MLLSWIFRGFLIAAGFVASWFVAKDAPQFGIMQMAVVLILVVSGSGLLRCKLTLKPISPIANPCCTPIVGVVPSLGERQCDDAISSKEFLFGPHCHARPARSRANKNGALQC